MSEAIRIQVTCQYLAESSHPAQQKYAFAYHVRIENTGHEAVQLMNRYWLITDADGKKTEVRGAGVVGKQPVIPPDECYEYSSGALLDTPVGSMQGYYEMKKADGSTFQAPIPVFSLVVPHLIN
ncbi:Co2+/Mg2+ efflux protein ApaG [Lacimicrobium alkaliphilum]|uniref:Protein ApaG n=1 Tax=Lacimicrobium alkaliphilum TaxID=1526571 RepID=A0ABQ1QYN5_9ALTE|nr:Co2+/Mg2+ efflux protein ApaG [Lacimicrobium alkaliphilum]GGD48791.1 protein ApaG [Lacimicrobium alkaliphilum]